MPHTPFLLTTKLVQFLLLVFLVGSSLAVCANPDSVIQLGNKREIFIDNFLIERSNGVQLKMHNPRKEETILKFDKPWEGKYGGYVTVIKEKHLFRAYYRGLGTVTDDASSSSVVCYAESNDGITWVKPALGISKKYNGISNIILENQLATGNFSPFLDLNPDVKKNQKFKAIGGHEKEGIMAYVSSDGIHWKLLSKKPILTKQPGDPQLFDSQNVVFWSESEKKYVCYFRTRVDNGKGDDRIRSVARTTSDDFINWTKPVNMTFDRGGFEHFYIQQTSPYYRAPHIYIALAARFMKNRQVVSAEEGAALNMDLNYIKDCSDAVIMSSRGQNHYARTFMESFIRPEIGVANWTSRTNYPALNVVETSPEEMSLYMAKDYAQPSAHIQRYSMRIDGFSSLNAPYSGGELITKPFTFTGSQLEINYATSTVGEIRIEIQDLKGNPLPGYTLKDCEVIIGNQISRIVKWKGHRSIGRLADKPVRLRIYLKDADLFSLQFQ